jgi:DNA (cytosine-5)-methyltransferase 1
LAERKKYTVVSLFAGCGGLDLGFKKEGFDLVYSCDNDPAAIKVYKNNVDPRAYVRDVTSEEFHQDIKSLRSCDVVLGGFPCQGFSKAGPKNSSDIRNLLYLEMKQAVANLQPSIFIAENVDGLSQNFKGVFLEQIISDFKEVGYNVSYKILDAVNYGVAQHRRRIFFVGQKVGMDKHQFPWPNQTHRADNRNGERHLNPAPNLLNELEFVYEREALTIREAIGDIRKLKLSIPDHKIAGDWSSDYQKIIASIGEGQKLCNVRFSDTSVYTWNIPEVFGDVDNVDIEILETIGRNRRHKRYGNIPNGNPLPEAIIKELSGLTNIKRRLESLTDKGYLKPKNDGYDLKGAMFCSGLFKRPFWNDPCQTVLTNFYNPRYFIHPKEDRPFSLRECARLQGFPDDFLFTTSDRKKELIDGYRLVGNAVAPPLGQVFAISTKLFLKNMKSKKNETTQKRSNHRKATA